MKDREDDYEAGEDPDAYEVIRLRLSWGGVSLALLTVLVAFNAFLMQLGTQRIILLALTPLLLLTGLVLGGVGLKFDKKKAVARWSVLLNGSIVALIILLAVAWYLIRR